MNSKFVISIVLLALLTLSGAGSFGNLSPDETATTGHLSGQVTDTSGMPLENVKIRIEYHGIFQETFSDENGFYAFSDIPVCFCLKRVTASKDGYSDFVTEIGISEHTVLDIVME